MKKKRILLLILLGVLFLGVIYPIELEAEGFSDLENNWTRVGLEYAIEKEILKGDRGKIRPNDILTRGELAAISTRLLGLEKKWIWPVLRIWIDPSGTMTTCLDR